MSRARREERPPEWRPGPARRPGRDSREVGQVGGGGEHREDGPPEKTAVSPTIGLPPPPAERCLETSRKSRYRGGTLIAEDVHDLAEHQRRLADADQYRPAECPACAWVRMHVHTRPERHPLRDPSLPPVVEVLQFRCASEACGATWRVLPLFLARHLWHAWKAVERGVLSPARATAGPTIAGRTLARWRARLASSARLLVVMLAVSGGSALEEVSKGVGLSGTRMELVEAYQAAAGTPEGERLSALGALLHRLERGIRLM